MKFELEQLWNLDSTLAGIIADAVEQFSEHAGGRPVNISEKRWIKIQRKIVKGFRVYHELDGAIPTEKQHKQFEKAMALFAEWFAAFWY